MLSLSTQPNPLLSGARKGLKGSEVNLRPFGDLKVWAASPNLSSPFNQEMKDKPRIFPHYDESCPEKNPEPQIHLKNDRNSLFLIVCECS